MRRAAAGSTNIGVELDSSAAVSGRWEEREKKREGGGGAIKPKEIAASQSGS